MPVYPASERVSSRRLVELVADALPHAGDEVDPLPDGVKARRGLPLRRDAVVYDINYLPLETELIKGAARRGHRTADGLGMLLHQAVPAFARWFGVTPQVTPALRTLLEDDIRAKTKAP